MQVEEMQQDEVIEVPEENIEVDENETVDSDAQDDDLVVVSIGDEKPEEEAEESKPAAPWVRELRKASREKDKRIKELERELQSKAAPEPAKPALGPRPTLEGCDYDEDRYNQEIDAWYAQKRQVEAVEAQAKAEEQKAEQAWQEKLSSYAKHKAGLKVADFEEAEAVAMDILSEIQRAMIIDASDNPALVICALGKNPGKARELAAITSHTKFLREISRLEDTKLKVSSRKAPPPERVASSGSGSISGAVDSALDRLREEAAKTGDYSKVIAYKNAQKRK